ncbi:MAG: catD [Planctomycetaceae bacterium]|nr:catD [Planctomycetaceae bacterium]
MDSPRRFRVRFVLARLILIGCGLFVFAGSDPARPVVKQEESREAQAARGAAATAEVPSADGVIIRYEVHGAGEPTLVFIHGWCCDRTFWQPQLDHFAKSRRVVAIDLGGHGASGLGRKNWSMAAFGKDVAAVVDKLQLKSVVLVGHSMGGPVMLEAAPLLKERLVGLVGVDTLTDPDEKYSAEQIAEYRKPFEKDFAAGMREALRHEHDFFTGKTSPVLIERIVAKMSSASGDVGVSAFQAMFDFANEFQRPRMKEVKVPLVCINAVRDPKKVEAGRKYAPQFEVLTLPDAGHFLMMEYPNEFNALLEKTLAEMTVPANKPK